MATGMIPSSDSIFLGPLSSILPLCRNPCGNLPQNGIYKIPSEKPKIPRQNDPTEKWGENRVESSRFENETQSQSSSN
jgi:hypothetical protein